MPPQNLPSKDAESHGLSDQYDEQSSAKTIVIKTSDISAPTASPPRDATPRKDSLFFRNRKRNVDSLIGKSRFTSIDSKVEVGVVETQSLAELDESYQMLDEFAEGGVGRLSSARDKVLKRIVAVKSLKHEFFGDNQIVNDFMAEAELTAQLDHPSIVPVHSLNKGADGLHIAMKLVNGKTLREYLRETSQRYTKLGVESFDESRALSTRLEYFLKICDAISYAHNKGVLHRDIKPENVMIGEFNEVYVMDWGIATLKKIDATRPDGRSGTVADAARDTDECIKGTPGYMAPESFSRGLFDEKTEQFGLGMILFEMATLNCGIAGDTPNTIIKKTLNGSFEQVVHKFKGQTVPLDLQAIIRKACNMSPDRRYESVKTLADDIRRLMAGEEIRARPDNLIRKMSRWTFQHRQAAAVLFMATLLGMACLAIASLVRQNMAEREAQRRELRLLDFQGAVSEEAHCADRYFIRLRGILENFAGAAEAVLRSDTPTTHPKLYSNADLSDSATAPPDTVQSTLYQDRVSLNSPVYKLAPEVAMPSVENSLLRLASLHEAYFRTMASSSPDGGSADAAARHNALTSGFPLRYIYVGLAEGAVFMYPGKAGVADGYDPRARPWYKNAVENHSSVVWSQPYYDAWGQGLIITASVSLEGTGGRSLGVAGLDVTLDYIVKEIMPVTRRDPRGAIKYLLDPQGNVLLSSNITSLEDDEKRKTGGQISLKPFHAKEIIPLLQSHSSGQITYNRSGVETLAAFYPVDTLGWFLVVEINLKRYLD